jgi:hypothetical protein
MVLLMFSSNVDWRRLLKPEIFKKESRFDVFEFFCRETIVTWEKKKQLRSIIDNAYNLENSECEDQSLPENPIISKTPLIPFHLTSV